MKIFPKRLSKYRKSLKLTQSELADKIGTSRGTIANYESGVSFPQNIETVFKFCEIFNCTPNDLMWDESEKLNEYYNDEELIKNNATETIESIGNSKSKEVKKIRELLHKLVNDNLSLVRENKKKDQTIEKMRSLFEDVRKL